MTLIVKIRDISTQIRGVSYSKSDAISNMQDGYLPVLRANNIQEQGLFLDDFVYVPESKISEKQRILAGDVIIAASSGSISLVGKAASAKEDIKAGFGAFCKILRPNTKLVDPRYFANYFQTQKYRQIISNLAAGANINNLKNEHLDDLEILLPPLSEQRRIAAILDKADELRQKRQQAIEKLDQLLQATFIDMFGDPVSNPKGWNLGKLGDVIHSAKDGPHVSPNYSETGIPFLSTRHVRAGKIIWEDLKFITEEDAQIHWKKCKPTRGDILYTKGGTTGLAAVVDTDIDFAVWVHVALLKTNHDKVRAEWLVSMLNTQYCYEQSQRYTHGIANRDLGLKRMVNIEMYLPPLDEQDKFVNFKNKLMKNNVLFKNSSSSFEKLFKSLQNQAFSGTL